MKKAKNETDKKVKKKKTKKSLKWGIVFVLTIALAFVFYNLFLKRTVASQNTIVQSEQATLKDLEFSLSSSGTIQPLDSYTVTTKTSIEGTVLNADFEEGDIVKKGDILYTISTDDLDSKIDTAKKNVDKSEKNYKKAKDDYQTAKEDYSDYTVESDLTGYIKEIKVKKGDSIQAGSSVIAEIYDNTKMELYIAFNASDVNKSLVGKSATVELTETEEALKGKVTEVSTIDEALSGNRIVRYVTIEINNPGGISVGTEAFAKIGSVECNEEGTFRLKEEGTILATVTGKVSKVNYKKGDWIKKGNTIVEISADTYDSQLKGYEDQIDTAKDNLDTAKDDLEKVVDSKTDYIITSPITGTVIKKHVKEGDTVTASNMNSGLCILYDMSAMTFQMQIDELDIMEIEIGQTVRITADALEGEEFQGTITNISLESNVSGGVTQYPVSVRIEEAGKLLPGMNVDGEVIVSTVKKALTVPTNSLMRGNQIYVKDETVTETVGEIPSGYKAVEVKVGISDGSYLEILDGLEEGEEVYVPARKSSDASDSMFGGGGMRGQGMTGGESEDR